MMKKRRILPLLLILTLLLAGCGAAAKPQTGTVTPPPETTAPGEPENPLSLGRLDGGTYTNTYAGFACDLDENWTYYSAQELQELPAGVLEAMDGTEMAEQMKDVEFLTDMMAENAGLLATVNVGYSKQDLASRLAMQALSEEDMLNVTLEQQKDQMIEAYAQAGIQTKSLEKVRLTFLGEPHWGLKTVAETQGVPCYILQVFNFKAGVYGVTLTCTSFAEDNTQSILDLFYSAE